MNTPVVNGQDMTIQQSASRGIIDWNSFSIANGESVHFQQNVSDAVLNRVTGGNLSEIYGTLSGNGSVFLINPNGILVGASGVISVNNFVGSTFDVMNQQFLAGGDIQFSQNGNSGTITNLGKISATGGDVFLIARQVTNEGLIAASKGQVGIAAGYEEVLLKESGSDRLYVRVKKAEEKEDEDEDILTEDTESTETGTTSGTKDVDSDGLTSGDTEGVDSEEETTNLTNQTNLEGGDEFTTEGSINEDPVNPVENESEETDSYGLSALDYQSESESNEEFTWVPLKDANKGSLIGQFTNEEDSPEKAESQIGIEEKAAINNKGSIEAIKAELAAVSGNIYALAINNEGIVRATGVEVNEGTVHFLGNGGDITNSGELSAHNDNGSGGSVELHGGAGSTVISDGIIDVKDDTVGSSGGRVVMTGMNVGLLGDAVVEASGGSGGGEVLIGGDYLGQNDSLMNADVTIMSKDAKITVDSLDSGDGGKAILWADDHTGFYGEISAKGGNLIGDGGFVETSGKNTLDAHGTVNASAVNGYSGSWLLDPRNVTISNATTNGAFDSASPNTFTPTGDSATVLSTVIDGSLTAGTSVIIQTVDAGGAQEGNITLDANISKTGGGAATLTLKAENNIVVNANRTITSTTGTLDVVFNADSDASSAGSIKMNAGSSITTNGGAITMGGGANPVTTAAFGVAGSTDGVNLNGVTLTTGGGNLTIRGQGLAAGGKGVSIDGTTAINTAGGDLTIVGVGANAADTSNSDFGVALNNANVSLTTTTGAVTIHATGGGRTSSNTEHGLFIRGASVSTSTGTMNITGLGSTNAAGASNSNFGIFMDTAGRIQSTGTSGAGAITITATGGVSGGAEHGLYMDSGVISSSSGNVSITASGGAGGVGLQMLNSAKIESTGTANLSIGATGTGGANGVTTTGGTNIIGSATNTGTMTLSGGTMSLSNFQVQGTTGSSLSLTTTSAITQDNAWSVGTLALSSGGSITLTNAANTFDTIGNITRAGALDLFDSAGGLSVSGAINSHASAVQLRTVGDFSMTGTSSIGSSNANITVEASGGYFSNSSTNAGTALNPTGTGRFLVYSKNSDSSYSAGGLSGTSQYLVSYPNDPLAAGDVFYFTDAEPVVTSSSSSSNVAASTIESVATTSTISSAYTSSELKELYIQPFTSPIQKPRMLNIYLGTREPELFYLDVEESGIVYQIFEGGGVEEYSGEVPKVLNDAYSEEIKRRLKELMDL